MLEEKEGVRRKWSYFEFAGGRGEGGGLCDRLSLNPAWFRILKYISIPWLSDWGDSHAFARCDPLLISSQDVFLIRWKCVAQVSECATQNLSVVLPLLDSPV